MTTATCKACPKCGEMIAEYMRQCPGCRAFRRRMTTCYSCRGLVHVNQNDCPHCNAPQTTTCLGCGGNYRAARTVNCPRCGGR